jgi:hypothetical protein
MDISETYSRWNHVSFQETRKLDNVCCTMTASVHARHTVFHRALALRVYHQYGHTITCTIRTCGRSSARRSLPCCVRRGQLPQCSSCRAGQYSASFRSDSSVTSRQLLIPSTRSSGQARAIRATLVSVMRKEPQSRSTCSRGRHRTRPIGAHCSRWCCEKRPSW